MADTLRPVLERRLKAEVTGDVRFDRFTRGRYATDASHYQIMPRGVVAPRTMDDAARAIAIAREEGVSVLARGGEILKFIGDAMLAIFPMQDDLDRDGKCRIALDAAVAAQDGLRELNELRTATGQPALKIGIGLHAGSVSYGNIGAAQGEDARLDFTVIGPAVNLATRIETLCPLLDEPIIASKQFASVCGSKLRPLGAHHLRGFAEKQEVYGLPGR